MSRSVDRVRLRNAMNRGDLLFGDTTETVSTSLDVAAETGKGIANIVQASKKKPGDKAAVTKQAETPKPKPQASGGMPTWAKVGLGVGGAALGVGLIVKLMRR